MNRWYLRPRNHLDHTNLMLRSVFNSGTRTGKMMTWLVCESYHRADGDKMARTAIMRRFWSFLGHRFNLIQLWWEQCRPVKAKNLIR